MMYVKGNHLQYGLLQQMAQKNQMNINRRQIKYCKYCSSFIQWNIMQPLKKKKVLLELIWKNLQVKKQDIPCVYNIPFFFLVKKKRGIRI